MKKLYLIGTLFLVLTSCDSRRVNESPSLGSISSDQERQEVDDEQTIAPFRGGAVVLPSEQNDRNSEEY